MTRWMLLICVLAGCAAEDAGVRAKRECTEIARAMSSNGQADQQLVDACMVKRLLGER